MRSPSVFGRRFDRVPRIAPVQSHPDMATRTGWPAKADLIPRNGMRVVGMHDIGNDAIFKEQPARHAGPRRAGQFASLHTAEEIVLLCQCKLVERCAVSLSCFLLQRRETSAPRVALRRQLGVSIAVESPVGHFLIDICGQWHRRTAFGLRHDPRAHGLQRAPFRDREKPGLPRHRQTPVDHLPRRLIPRLLSIASTARHSQGSAQSSE